MGEGRWAATQDQTGRSAGDTPREGRPFEQTRNDGKSEKRQHTQRGDQHGRSGRRVRRDRTGTPLTEEEGGRHGKRGRNCTDMGLQARENVVDQTQQSEGANEGLEAPRLTTRTVQRERGPRGQSDERATGDREHEDPAPKPVRGVRNTTEAREGVWGDGEAPRPLDRTKAAEWSLRTRERCGRQTDDQRQGETPRQLRRSPQAADGGEVGGGCAK
ncbi:hypothetical protein Tco_0008510 [Tanacetum coccineum]